MVSLDDAVVARLSRGGTTFEILVDPDGTERFIDRGDEEVTDAELVEMLAVEDVFVDWSEGERASEEQCTEAFDTTEVAKIARRILETGDIQITAQQRKKMLERKQKRILDIITKNAWDPQAKTPHPRERIERALEEAKFRVDPLKGVQPQVKEAIGKLRPLMPIAMERVKVAIKVPPEYTGVASGPIHTIGDLQREEWQSDGSLIAVLEIPAGMQGEIYERLNQVTHGSVETRLLDE